MFSYSFNTIQTMAEKSKLGIKLCEDSEAIF